MSDTHEYRVFVLVLSANTREYSRSKTNTNTNMDLRAAANIRYTPWGSATYATYQKGKKSRK